MKKILLIILVILVMPMYANAQRGCCSRHGGVAGCSSNGRQICNDGTLSPTCTCTPPKSVTSKSDDNNTNNYNNDISVSKMNYSESISNDDKSYEYNQINEETSEDDNESDMTNTIIGSGIVGVVGYILYKSRKRTR